MGTLAAGHLLASVAVMLVAGFTISFVGALGGYAAAGNYGLMVSVILALLVPGVPGDIGSRVWGWFFACALGAVASVVLWPVRYRPRVRLDLAAASRRLASVMHDPGNLRDPDQLEHSLDAISSDLVALRTRLDADITRPSGPRARDQALLYLLDSSGRTVVFLRRIVTLRRGGAALAPTDVTALGGAADVLDATADVLTGARTSVPTAALIDDRSREISSVQEALIATDDGSAGPIAPEHVVDRFDMLFPVRMVTYLALSMATNALVATGNPTGDTSFEYQSAAPTVRRTRSDTVHRLAGTLRSHLTPRSRWFRNAARVALALAAAVAIADLANFDHAFWIGLSALSVLRSSVLDTGASVLAAVLGTLIGFVLATVLLSIAGEHTVVLWVVFPFAVFAAGYLPKAVDYGAGQAAFTLMVVVLYNLSEPVGWHLGLVRLERVGLGVTVAALTAVVLWPHGASRDLANAIRAEIDSAFGYFQAGLCAVLGDGTGADERSAALHEALAARMVAESELGNFMNSRGSKRVEVGTWALLVSQPHALVLGGDWLGAVSVRQGVPAAVASSQVQVHAAVDALDAAAQRLAAPFPRGPGGGPGGVGADLDEDPDGDLVGAARGAVAAMVTDASARESLSEPQSIALLWALQWLTFVRPLRHSLVRQFAEVDHALERSWWR